MDSFGGISDVLRRLRLKPSPPQQDGGERINKITQEIIDLPTAQRSLRLTIGLIEKTQCREMIEILKLMGAEQVTIPSKPIFLKVLYGVKSDEFFILFKFSNQVYYQLKKGENLSGSEDKNEFRFIEHYIDAYHQLYLLQSFVIQNEFDDSYETTLKYARILKYNIEKSSQGRRRLEITSGFWHEFVKNKINYVIDNSELFFNLISKFEKVNPSLIQGLYNFFNSKPEEQYIEHPLIVGKEIDVGTGDVIYDPISIITELLGLINEFSFKVPPFAKIPSAPIIDYDPDLGSLQIIFHDNTHLNSAPDTVRIVYFNSKSAKTPLAPKLDNFDLSNPDGISTHGGYSIVEALTFFHNCWEIYNRISQVDFKIKDYDVLTNYINKVFNPESPRNIREHTQTVSYWQGLIAKIVEYQESQIPTAIMLLNHIKLWEEIMIYKRTMPPDGDLRYKLFDAYVLKTVENFLREKLTELEN